MSLEKDNKCPVCNKTLSTKGNLKTHLWTVHDIGNGKIYKCEQDGCEYETKMNSNLKTHLWEVHDIGNGKIYKCEQDGCEYETKRNGHLKTHLRYFHDNGPNQCTACLEKHQSSILHKGHRYCRKCYRKLTGKNSRAETVWSNYVDKHLGTDFLTSSDKSLKSLGGCQLYRPDKLYIGLTHVELDECDENQHINGENYSCDEKRISDIYDEDGIVGKTLIVIRFNPHSYKINNVSQKTPVKERYDRFIQLKRELREKVSRGNIKDTIHVYYMYYNKDNRNITKNFPHSFVY